MKTTCLAFFPDRGQAPLPGASARGGWSLGGRGRPDSVGGNNPRREGAGVAPTTGRKGPAVRAECPPFFEDDFRAEGEWLLSPKPRGWSELPPAVADALRRVVIEPLRVKLEAPAGIGLYLFDGAACLYNFHDTPAPVKLDRLHDVPFADPIDA